ncbi:uncharacterized protein PAC_08147 [Phialocephala subalpina]|uniref:Uncharacterized protein n=1 Tax=Phialocephala subalpina TaxID=576137 RepID=A0A1L7WZR6_9HELO|nr:uncharacterized protein PAC_08147 [Phialocephala subalpina]
MKGDPEFVILKYSAWLETSAFESRILGSVIRYPLKPSNEYVPSGVSPLQYNTFDLVKGALTDFVLANKNTTSHDASLSLTSIAGFAFKGNTDDSVHLAGKLVRYKRLQQHGQFWAKLKADQAVRDAVPGWVSLLNTWPPCLVVGIMTAEDVKLDFSDEASHDNSGHAEVPLATLAVPAASAAGNLLGGSDVGNLKAKAGGSQKVARVFKAKSGQSSIFALELRIVTTAWMRQRELKLKEGGPKIKPGRLAGDEDISDSESEDEEPQTVEDLVLEGFTEKEYSQMID